MKKMMTILVLGAMLFVLGGAGAQAYEEDQACGSVYKSLSTPMVVVGTQLRSVATEACQEAGSVSGSAGISLPELPVVRISSFGL